MYASQLFSTHFISSMQMHRRDKCLQQERTPLHTAQSSLEWLERAANVSSISLKSAVECAPRSLVISPFGLILFGFARGRHECRQSQDYQRCEKFHHQRARSLKISLDCCW